MLHPFKSFIVKENLFQPEEKILLTVSGGMDSVVMANLFQKSKLKFGIAHCNFQLRGEESDGDELFVIQFAGKFKVPCYLKRFLTTEYTEKNGVSTQMAARALRYAWFEEIRQKEKYDYIATAHHLDDQTETFFINMMRSSGIAGFHGILPKQGKVIRPMLFTTRKEIEEYTLKHKLPYREDSSNEETKYLRNKIRHQILPSLHTISPDFSRVLNENITRIREAEKIFRESVETARERIVIKEKDNLLISINDLKKLVPLTTYLFEFLSPLGFNFTVISNIAQALDDKPGGQFFSPTHRVIKDRDYLIITVKDPDQQRRKDHDFFITTPYDNLMVPLRLSLKVLQNNDSFSIDNSPLIAQLDLDKITFPLKLRKWQSGDQFYPFGQNNKKKLSDFFTDLKFSLDEKENCWLLCSDEKIIWIVGYRIDNRYRITPKTKEVLLINWQQ
jgi:tRNA(Ile)-lysidine synthase